MTDTVESSNGIQIRLTDERWAHITDEHFELAAMRRAVLECIGHPQRVLEGWSGELLAVRELELGRSLVVVYRETGADGFVITAFVTRRTRALDRRRQLWP
jgi:hypothetical protein